MRGARFGEKNRNVSVFFERDPSVLYWLAALPDELAATLTPDTLLTDPAHRTRSRPLPPPTCLAGRDRRYSRASPPRGRGRRITARP
jgi:hypothetical protein